MAVGHNRMRLCGTAWSECGYCKGARSSLVGREPTASSKVYTVLCDVVVSNQDPVAAEQTNGSNDYHHHQSAGTTLHSSSTTTTRSTDTATPSPPTLDAALYEALLYRGWRRSGIALYQPDNRHSCCPAYTIRLPIASFQPSKSQRKMMKRAQQLLQMRDQTATAPQKNEIDTDTTATDRLAPWHPPAKQPPSRSNGGHQKQQQPPLPPLPPPPRSRNSAAEQLVRQSGLWSALQEATQTALSKLDVLRNQPDLHKQTMPAVTFKIQQPRKKVDAKTQSDNSQPSNHKATNDDSHCLLTAYTSVCAAVAGRSHGVLDRGRLAQDLCQVLEAQTQNLSRSSTSNLDPDKEEGPKSFASPPEDAMAAVPNKKHRISEHTKQQPRITIQAFEAHIESGHVLVHLMVEPEALEQYSNTDVGALPDQEASKEMSPPRPQQVQGREQVNNRLIQWIRSKVDVTSWLPSGTDSMEVITLPAYQSALLPQVHRLYWEYQHLVHGDADPFHDDLSSGPESTKSLSEHDKTGDDDDDDDDSTAAWNWAEKAPNDWFKSARNMLYREYQHLNPARQQRLVKAFGEFCTFLVEHPFERMLNEKRPLDIEQTNQFNQTFPPSPGCYHQHYRLSNGGPLVAVGVVDVLPQGLSSVYLFYDHSFSQNVIPMGKYAIMREIEWAQRAKLEYYYLGYYIESCPKMRYKADYRPSQLLCPETYEWVDADEAKARIQRECPERHYCRLYQGDVKKTPLHNSLTLDLPSIINRIPLDVGVGQSIGLDMLQEHGQAILRPHLEAFVHAVGPRIAVQCTVVFC